MTRPRWVPLAEVHNIIAPRPDRNLGYPLLYSFLVVGVQAPYLLYLKASGGLGATGAGYPFGLTEPVGALRMLTWLAHLLTLVMAAVVIAAAYDTARVLWGERAAILAAVFVTCCYPMFYYSRTGNVDVPMLCFMALAVAAFARIRVLGTLGPAHCGTRIVRRRRPRGERGSHRGTASNGAAAGIAAGSVPVR